MSTWLYDLWVVNTDLGRACLVVGMSFIPVPILAFTLAIIMVRDRKRAQAAKDKTA